MLADLQARRELTDAKMERDAPACIFSVLSLVTERIGQLRRVVRNEENPGQLVGPSQRGGGPRDERRIPRGSRPVLVGLPPAAPSPNAGQLRGRALHPLLVVVTHLYLYDSWVAPLAASLRQQQ